MERVYSVVPVKVPDGRTVWEERGKAKDVIDALRAFDPAYSLVRRWEPPGWQVVRRWDDGHESWELTVPGDYLPDPGWWLDVLRRHDTHAGYDPLAAVEASNAALERARDAEVEEIALASADRLHYELVDEHHAHAPAARPMFLNPATRRGRRRRIGPDDHGR